MSLVAKQDRFTRCLAKLLYHADAMGHRLVLAETYRPPEMAEIYAKRGTGIRNSLHTLKLAADFILFDDYDKPIWDGTAYEPLGKFWLALDPEAAWGGDFTRADPGHVSLRHEGRA